MLSRYDYSSLVMQGYLDGPRDMEIETVSVLTLDDMLEHYLPEGLKIDILKVD